MHFKLMGINCSVYFKTHNAYFETYIKPSIPSSTSHYMIDEVRKLVTKVGKKRLVDKKARVDQQFYSDSLHFRDASRTVHLPAFSPSAAP